jgi:hypothetical protein
LVDGRGVALVVGILVLLMFSKYFYTLSISNYSSFYLTGKFGIGVHSAQLHRFAFLGAVALGTLMGARMGNTETASAADGDRVCDAALRGGPRVICRALTGALQTPAEKP